MSDMIGQMARQAETTITIDPNVRCLRIYPVEGSAKTVDELKTVGVKLSSDQAIHLSRVLLAAAQEWEEIDLTAWRLDRRKSDKTHHITVTSLQA